jgi:uncharacterized membrane protein
MTMTLVLHIVAGALGLLSGYTALYSAKGATLHRKSGTVFVSSMLAMAVFGMVISAGRGVAPAINLPAGLLTAYLAVTGLTSLQAPRDGTRRFHRAGMLLAAALGLACFVVAADAIADGGRRAGLAYPLVMFGVVALLGSNGDRRMLLAGPSTSLRASGLSRGARLARHLWRMCFALFIAALSFFVGQAQVIPEPLRIRPLLALPVVAVLATMFFWLWRVRAKRSAGRVAAFLAHPVEARS